MPETRRVRQDKPDLEFKPTVAKAPVADRIIKVKVQSLFPAHVIYVGRVSGQRYDYLEAGAILEVDSRDVADMLTYRIGTTGCCGGSDPNGNQVFQEFKE